MDGWLSTLISVLIGGGGVAFVTTLVRSWSTLRAGARARERDTLADSARWREETDDARREAERDRDYWRRTAGGYAYQLRAKGVEPIPAEPVPPSERAPASGA